MITDEQRREAATRLRTLTDGESPMTEYSVNDMYTALGFPWSFGTGIECAVIRHLADLIDRQTCHISETDHEFEDSVRCDRCLTTFNRPWEPFKYCPNCGAEVADDAQL